VLVKETPGTGLVAVNGYVKAGAMFDGSRSGLARFVAAMLLRGTSRYTAQELAELLDAMGASLGVRADMEVGAVGLRVLSEDAGAALALLGEVMMRPTFPAEETEKVRGEILTSVRVGLQDTRQMAERTFRSLLYPEAHPYRHLPDGEESVMASVGRDDLTAFHRQYYRPEAVVLAVVGDVRAGEIVGTLAQVFASWPRGGGWALPHLPAVSLPVSPRRGETRLEGKVQSDIVLGAPGVARTAPAYYEVMMANLILGQLGMMGRLGERVRERQGMAYYAFSELRAGLLAGPWLVRAGVNPANEQAAVDGILGEIRRFQQDGPADDELADARDYLVGSLAVRLETNAGMAQMLADMELFDLGLDYLVRYPQLIHGVRRDAIIEAAQRFPHDSYCLAVAGPRRS
jgi:zinc protease